MSLKRLGMEVIDLYCQHRVDPGVLPMIPAPKVRANLQICKTMVGYFPCMVFLALSG